jgi:adenylate kinase family enzyme
MVNRIHLLGASGSGTTTLGRALAERLRCTHIDTDAYFWLPTEPPFLEPRPLVERQQCLMHTLTANDAWVLSGSLCGWGDVAIPLFELVVFLWLPMDIRMKRLRHREHERYGERIMPGGDMYEQSQAFLEWAALYDNGDVNMRSRRRHEQWLSTLLCPMICIEGEHAIEAQLDVLMPAIQQ